MPKIFEYLGIVFYFYSNEHEPIHVHARYGEYESKAEFYIVDSKIEEIRISNIKGAKPLEGKALKNFKAFLGAYSSIIVKKWIDYFIYHSDVEFERITKKLP